MNTMAATDSWGREAKWLTKNGKNLMLSDMKTVKEEIYNLTKDYIAQEYPDRIQEIELPKPDKTEFEPGEVVQFPIVVQPASAAGSVRWSSSDEAVASVDENGRITMKKEGKATITVCSPENANIIEQSVEIIVKTPEAKKPLLQQIQAASGLKQGDYTAESWAALQKALEEAENVRKNPQSQQEDIDRALNALKDAISKLAPAVSDPGKPNDPVVEDPIKESGIYENGNYKYKITSLEKQTVEVVGTTNSKLKKIVIGKSVTLGAKSFQITSIKTSAFKNNKKITEVKIGTNVTSIGNSAFEKCIKLKKVTINSKKLTQIGKKAFAGCKKLRSVVVKSKKVKKIGKGAFKGIHKKAVVKIPKSKK